MVAHHRHAELNIAFLNVCSLRKKVNEVQNVIAARGIHIMCIAETWLDDSVSDGELTIPHFCLHRRDRSEGRGGGVCMYIHESLSAVQLKTLESNALELMWMEIHGKKRKHLVGCYYRPPSALAGSWDILENVLEQATAVTDDLILAGDLNVNMLDSQDANYRRLHSITTKFSLVNHVKSPTRVSRACSSMLDVFFVSEKTVVTQCEVLTSDISDHFAILAHLKWHHPKEKALYQSRNLADINWNRMNEDLRDTLNSFLVSTDDVHDSAVRWQNKVLSVLDAHAPLKWRNRYSSKQCPWLTEDLQSRVRERNYLHRQLCREPDDETLRNRHRCARREARKLERKLKNQYFQSLCNSNSPRLLWRAINTVTGRQRENTSTKASLDELSSTFAAVVHDDQRPGELPIHYGPPRETCFSAFLPVTQDDVFALLCSVDANKATGSDGLPGKILKNCASSLAPSLTLIFNASLQVGVVPSVYKQSNISPLFKSGDRSKASNYRPVSLLPIVSRLLEKIVQRQLVAYLRTNNLFPVSQFAYRTGHSTEDALILAVHRWQMSRFRHETTAVAFLDMSKAFDRVSHSLMIEELFSLGIHSRALLWFRDYLSNRMQRVCAQSQVSPLVPCTRGVPQGSVLGPLLFTLYIRRIGDVLPSSVNHQEFADDILIDCSGKNAAENATLLSQAITAVQTWLNSRGLLLNTAKTQVMFIHPRGVSADEYQVSCGPTLLETVKSVKYLGLQIDCDFSWHSRLGALEKSVSKLAGAMWRNGKGLTLSARRTWLTAIVRSQLTYSSNAFLPSLAKLQLDRVIRMFKYCVRTIFFLHPPASSGPLLLSLGLPRLQTVLHNKVAYFVHRCLTRQASPLFADLFCQVGGADTRPTRGSHHNLLVVPFMPGSAGRTSLNFYGSVLWNGLPSSVRSLVSSNEFRVALKSFASDLPVV